MKALKPILALLGSVVCLGVFFYAPVARGDVSRAESSGPKVGTHPGGIGISRTLAPAEGNRLAGFSGGCFWGIEDGFRQVQGVVATAVGYTGGHVPNPTYEQVCSHTTGHMETVLVEFNPKIISYKDLLTFFWKIHDPTTEDRQGPDVGSNYRSAIWTYGADEYKEALASREKRQAKERARIVTGIHPAAPFYIAEDYHQQYDEKTGTHSCPLPRGG